MELPSYPAGDDTAPDKEPATTGSRAIQIVLAGIVATIVGVIVILHLTGVVGP